MGDEAGGLGPGKHVRAGLGGALRPAHWQDELAAADHYCAAELLAYIRQLSGPKVLVDITPSLQFAKQYPDYAVKTLDFDNHGIITER